MKGYWYFFGINKKKRLIHIILQYPDHKNRRFYSKNPGRGGHLTPFGKRVTKMAQVDEGFALDRNYVLNDVTLCLNDFSTFFFFGVRFRVILFKFHKLFTEYIERHYIYNFSIS